MAPGLAETGKVTNVDEKPIEVGAPITNSIIVRGDNAYVAHYNNRVVSFDLAKRARRWEFGESDFAFWASPAVTAEAVYVAGRGKRVFRMAPIHHHFEEVGWAEQKIVVRFWIVSIVLGLIALSSLKLR